MFLLLPIHSTQANPYSYQTFEGQSLSLYRYEGANTFFWYSPAAIPQITASMATNHILPSFDQAMANYRTMGQVASYPPSTAKGSVAIVPSTCGAGCGLNGKAEVLQSAVIEHLNGQHAEGPGYETDPTKATFWWIALYELGRGSVFGFYSKLDYRKQANGSRDYTVIGSAFPHVVANVTMNDRGFTPAVVKQKSINAIPKFKDKYIALMAQGYRYMDWHSAAGGVQTFQGLPSMDVMAVVIYEFYLRYGKTALTNFFDAAADLPDANTPLQAACNLSSAMDQALIHGGYASATASTFLVNEFAFPRCDGELRDRWYNGCLDLPPPQAVGTQAIGYQCNGGANQKWKRVPASINTTGGLSPRSKYGVRGERLVGVGDKCLQAGLQPNDRLVYQNCSKSNYNQIFYPVSGGAWQTESGHCVDVNGGTVLLWGCHGGNNQKWDFIQSAPY
ncbi:ricin-type beta-trefoil lectin domain protein [Sinimarinibacterium flocculans]|uniref:ricin-type beta-trefoil lectin domain protein n=1 Tax=Sinimarinibacterium flocculans TaxID=985250 RepID=UPI003519438E